MVRISTETEFNKELGVAGEVFKVIPIHKDDGPAINAACARGDPGGFERRRIWNGAKAAWAQSHQGAGCCICHNTFAGASSFSGVIGILPGGKFTVGGILFICNDCCANPEVVKACIDKLGRERLDC